MSSTYIFLFSCYEWSRDFRDLIIPISSNSQSNDYMEPHAAYFCGPLQATITILVVYCLKDISFVKAPLEFQKSLQLGNRSVKLVMVEGEYLVSIFGSNGHL